MLWGYGSKPVAGNGDHDPAARCICPTRSHSSIGGEGLVWPVLVVQPLQDGSILSRSHAPQKKVKSMLLAFPERESEDCIVVYD